MQGAALLAAGWVGLALTIPLQEAGPGTQPSLQGVSSTRTRFSNATTTVKTDDDSFGSDDTFGSWWRKTGRSTPDGLVKAFNDRPLGAKPVAWNKETHALGSSMLIKGKLAFADPEKAAQYKCNPETLTCPEEIDFNDLMIKQELIFSDAHTYKNYAPEYSKMKTLMEDTKGCKATSKVDTVAVCSMFANEAPMLGEWLEWQLSIGVGHVYLYNHDSTDNWNAVVAPFVELGMVSVNEIPRDSSNTGEGATTPIMYTAYNKCLADHGSKHRWLAFYDTDEYLVFKQHGMCFASWLESMELTHPAMGNGEFVGAIVVNWVMFGHRGEEIFSEYKAEDTYVQRTLTLEGMPDKIVKSIVRTDALASMDHPHYANLKSGWGAINAEGTAMPSEGIARMHNDPPTTSLVGLAHHRWGSFERFFNKKVKGRCDWTDRQQPWDLSHFHQEWKNCEGIGLAKPGEYQPPVSVSNPNCLIG